MDQAERTEIRKKLANLRAQIAALEELIDGETEKETMLRVLEAGVGPKIEPTTGDPLGPDNMDQVSDGYAPSPPATGGTP